jgi:hypothetical protein
MNLSHELCPCGLRVWVADGVKICPACGDLAEPPTVERFGALEYAEIRFKSIASAIADGRIAHAKKLAEDAARAIARAARIAH